MHTPAELADAVAAEITAAAATAGALLFRELAVDFPLNVSVVRSYADAGKPGTPTAGRTCEPSLALSGPPYSDLLDAEILDLVVGWLSHHRTHSAAAGRARPPACRPTTSTPLSTPRSSPASPAGPASTRSSSASPPSSPSAFLVWGLISTGLAQQRLRQGPGVDDDEHRLDLRADRSAFVVFVIWLALGRFGNIPLGRDDEEPEFRTISWIAMMFSAGMGIGLMFYGVSEPISHFVTPPPGTGADRQRADRDGHHALPLDPAPVGDLRRRRPRDRLRHLPQGPRPADQRRLRAAARPPRARTGRQGHRHARDLRDALRLRRLARPRRAPDP